MEKWQHIPMLHKEIDEMVKKITEYVDNYFDYYTHKLDTFPSNTRDALRKILNVN